MSRASILLRLMMVVLLVLNGIGGATASARMVFGHGAHAVALSASNAVGDPDCHDIAMAMEDGVDARMARAPLGNDGEEPGCCDTGACLCECAQHGWTMPALAAVAHARSGITSAVHPLTDGHPDPVTHRLIRPPIA